MQGTQHDYGVRRVGDRDREVRFDDLPTGLDIHWVFGGGQTGDVFQGPAGHRCEGQGHGGRSAWGEV